MKSNSLALFLCSGLVALSSALSAQPAPENKSPLAAVRRELSPDALFYTHIDLEGGWSKVGEDLKKILVGTSLEQRDFPAVFTTLGLADIRAIGMSSGAVEGGYDNRFFISTPGGRHGLLGIYPGKPEAFAAPNFAPADADLVIDLRVDIGALVDTAQTVALQLAPDPEATGSAIREGRTALGENGEALLKFKGRLAIVVRLHLGEAPAESGPAKSPADIFIWAETGGSAVAKLLEGKASWTRTETNNQVRFTATAGPAGLNPVIIITGEKMAAGMPASFVEECLNRKASSLADNADFKQALAQTAAEGHTLTYATPKLFSSLRDAMPLLSALSLKSLTAIQNKDALSQQLASLIPSPTQPIISVVVAREDGLLMRDRSTESLKSSLPLVSLVLPELLGRFATITAGAWAVEDRRNQAILKAKAELTPQLQRIGEAAAAYFAQQPEAITHITLTELRTALPNQGLPDLSDILAQELELSRHTDLITLQHAELGEITHILPLTPGQRTQIEANLRGIESAANEALVLGDEADDTVYAITLFNQGLPRPATVSGENYDDLAIDASVTLLSVRTPGDQEISLERDPQNLLKARRAVAEQQFAVRLNLARFDTAALKYLEANPDESMVTLEKLSETEEFKPVIEPVQGEDYAEIYATREGGNLRVRLPRGGEVSYQRPLPEDLKQAQLARLTAAEKAVSAYFKANPKANLVLIGEVFTEDGTTIAPESDEDAMDSGSASSRAPDLSAMVVEADYTSIRVPFGEQHILEVPRTK